MNTKKRNERTRRIFNRVMRAVMLAYGIRDFDIRNNLDMYTLLYANSDRVFYFLDKDGKIINNSLPYRDGDSIDFREKVNNGRKLKFYYSNKYNSYMDKHYQTGSAEYLHIANSLIKSISIDVCKYNRYQYGIDDCSSLDLRHEFYDYDGICSDSSFLRKLFKDYIEEQHNKNNYKCLVMFEDIFGYRCFTRKEFDRIRYIFFTTNNRYTPDHIYDINHDHFFSGIINSIIDSTHQNYNLNVYKSIFDNVFYTLRDISKSYNMCSFSEIKNKLLTEYTKRVKVEDMDLVDLEKAKLEELAYEYNFTALTRGSQYKLKDEFQLKHALTTNEKKNYASYQESNTIPKEETKYDQLMKIKESFDRLGIRGFNI